MGVDGMGAGVAEVLARQQAILNERPIPPRRLQRTDRRRIPVVVRLVWERDGEQLVDTRAMDWVGRDVLVELFDPRWATHGVWLDAVDVRRRERERIASMMRPPIRRARASAPIT